MSNWEYYLKTIIKYGLYVALFTPLIYTSSTFFPFIFGKTLFFRTIIEILFAIYLILAIAYPSYRPKRSVIFSAVLIYAGISILATLFSVDPLKSFWSNHERMMGLWTLLHAMGLFIIIGNIFKTKKEWRSFFGVSVFVSMIVAGLGIYQYFSNGFLHIVGGGRVYSTLGNYIYFGGYGLFHTIIATIFFLEEKKKKSIIGVFWLLGIIIGLISIYLSGTRGVLVAFCVAVVLAIILHILFYPSRKIRLILCSVLILSVLGGVGLWLNKESSFIKKNYLLTSLLDISLEAATGKTRLINWAIGFESWKQRPLLGWGPDTYNIAFNKYYNPEMFMFGSYETWQDRAHNIIIDTLNETGVIGLISYLSIFLLAFYLIFKSVRKKTLGFTSGVLIFSLLSAYFIQNLFVFDTITTLMLFYLILGFVHFLSTREETDENEHRVSDFVKKLDVAYKYTLVGILIFCTFFFIYRTNITHFQTSYLAIKGLKNFSKDFLGSVELYKEATSFNSPYFREARGQFTRVIMASILADIGLSKKQKKELLVWTAEEVEKNVEEHPLDAFYWDYIGEYYFTMARILEDEIYLEKSKNALDKALELSPKRQQFYFTLARFYLITQKYNKVIETLEQAVRLYPEVALSHWYLGIGYMAVNDLEKAHTEFKFGYRWGEEGLGLSNKGEIIIALKACLAAKDLECVDWLYKNIREINIDVSEYVEFADAYRELGEEEKAEELDKMIN